MRRPCGMFSLAAAVVQVAFGLGLVGMHCGDIYGGFVCVGVDGRGVCVVTRVVVRANG